MCLAGTVLPLVATAALLEHRPPKWIPLFGIHPMLIFLAGALFGAENRVHFRRCGSPVPHDTLERKSTRRSFLGKVRGGIHVALSNRLSYVVSHAFKLSWLPPEFPRQ
jgi:hypothetical protein